LAKLTLPVEETLDGFVKFSRKLVREDGRRLTLYPEQKVMLADYFRGCRETLILIPKKNGKTTLLAALALYHLRYYNGAAACMIGAASRDQATILYEQATGLVRRSELEHTFEVQKGYRRINLLGGNGYIRVLAADENTADGVIPTLALVDELHRHKSDALYGIFRDGLGPRKGRMITISTAGDDPDSPLGRLREQAYALPRMKSKGAYRHVHSRSFSMHEWALDSEADRDDLELVKTANPAPWQTPAALRLRHDSPSMTPWQWARFACGVWVFGELGAISGHEWRKCESAGAVIPEDAEDVFVGIDLGWKWDTTALVPLWRDGERLVVGEATIIVPPRDGSSTPYARVWAEVERLAELYHRPTFVIDPENGGEQLAQQIDLELDARVVSYSQKPAPMCQAAQRLTAAISGRRLEHPGQRELTLHVLAAGAKQHGEGWRLVKPRRGQAKIDAAVALAMAVSFAVETPAEVFALAW